MDYQRFIEQLPIYYENWGKDSVRPKSYRFEPVIEQVKGMTSANVMQLLNFAVECLEQNEVYFEVGCFQGASLIGAMLDHPEQSAYVVDNFSEFDALGNSFEKLVENIGKFELEDQVIFCNQDFEELFFDFRGIHEENPIGLYFYNGAQDYRSCLMGLLLVRPFLADKSIIVVSNGNWATVRQAIWDFISANPQSQLLFDLSSTKDYSYPVWTGLQVIIWDVNFKNNYDWSIYQKERNITLIRSIYDLHVTLRNKVVEEWNAEALKLFISGKYEEAENKYKQLLKCDINHADAWYNLGLLYYKIERDKDAFSALLKALELEPSKATLHYSIGRVLEKLGDTPQAILAHQQAIALDPQWISSYSNLGQIWLEAGEFDQAEAMYRYVIAASPEHFGGYMNLGNVLLKQHQIDEAIEAYEKALSLNPGDSDILNNLQVAFEAKSDLVLASIDFFYSFYKQEKYKEAINYYKKFIINQTGDVDFYLALADCYKRLNQYDEAITLYQEGISLYPKVAALYSNLGWVLQESGLTEEASAVLTEALRVLPEDLTLKLQKQFMLPIIYENSEEINFYWHQIAQALEELTQQISLDIPEATDSYLNSIVATAKTKFYLTYQGKNELELQKRYGQFVHRVMEVNYPNWTQPLPMLPLNDQEKIRVGYVSAFLRNHNGANWALGWIKNHNRQNFEIYCYYTGFSVGPVTREFQLYSNTFHHIPYDIKAVCQQIVADQLHILVFPEIGMDAQTIQIAGLRLAPVQCTAWGHPGTSGLTTIDYYLSSELMEPENAQEHYSEKLICLPNIGLYYEKSVIPELHKSRSDFQLNDDAIVYLSCQSLFKYLPQYDYIFPAIAQQVPQAQFAFLSHPSLSLTEKFQQRLKRAFALFNLNSEEYCVIVPRQDGLGYANLNLLSNIFLDTFSWSGGNTTLQAIAWNLPVVTCPGEFMRGRHSYAFLKMLGVTETIAKNEAEYVDIAVRLGLNQEWRDSIIQRMTHCHFSLYEDKNCVAGLEAFYHHVVKEGD